MLARLPVLAHLEALADSAGPLAALLAVGLAVLAAWAWRIARGARRSGAELGKARAAAAASERVLAGALRRQSALAELSREALRSADLDALLDRAVNVVSETLGLELCKVLELLPDEDALVLRAGVGWKDGLVGRARVDTGEGSQAGYTLRTRAPVLVEDLDTERRFRGPDLLIAHGVVSGLSVVVPGPSEPFGVLGAHTRVRRRFTDDDARFLQVVAHVLAEAVRREHADRELRRARHLAEESSRVKGEFLANMSHEIRTPLNGILGMSQLALDSELEGEQREYVETVVECGSTLLELIDDVLEMAEVEAGEIGLKEADLDVAACVRGAVEALERRARPKGLAVRGELPEDLPRLRGDASRLRQVLLKLGSNAVKFTEAGEVVVAVQARPAGPRDVELSFSVRDTGIGIPADRQRTLFDPFTQGDGASTRRYGGTGLGLSIASRVAARMDGRIDVESEPGRGSTFTLRVTLPVADSEAAAQTQPRLIG